MDDSVDDASGGSFRNEFRTRFGRDERPSHVIIRALASVEGVPPSEVDSLYWSVDPEALDSLLSDSGSGALDPMVEFGVSNYRIVAKGNGQITIYERR